MDGSTALYLGADTVHLTGGSVTEVDRTYEHVDSEDLQVATNSHDVIDVIRARCSYVAYIVTIRCVVVLILVIGAEFFLTAKVVRPSDVMKGPILFTFFLAALTMLIVWASAIRIFSTVADLVRREVLVGSGVYGELFKAIIRDLVRARSWLRFI